MGIIAIGALSNMAQGSSPFECLAHEGAHIVSCARIVAQLGADEKEQQVRPYRPLVASGRSLFNRRPRVTNVGRVLWIERSQPTRCSQQLVCAIKNLARLPLIKKSRSDGQRNERIGTDRAIEPSVR